MREIQIFKFSRNVLRAADMDARWKCWKNQRPQKCVVTRAHSNEPFCTAWNRHSHASTIITGNKNDIWVRKRMPSYFCAGMFLTQASFKLNNLRCNRKKINNFCEYLPFAHGFHGFAVVVVVFFIYFLFRWSLFL